MTAEPLQDRFRRVRVEHDMQPLLGDPPAGVGLQLRGLAAAVGPGNSRLRRIDRDRFGDAVHSETEPAQHRPSLVRGEIGTVETCHRGKDLLGRKASAVDHDIVHSERLGIEPGRDLPNLLRVQHQLGTSHRCHGHRGLLTAASLHQNTD